MREFRLTEPGFHGGQYQERGAIVSLLPHERPGQHMAPVRSIAAVLRAAPLAVVPVESLVAEPLPEPITLPHAGYLIVDTETTGFDDPRLASLALIFADSALEIEHAMHVLIRPDGWTMPSAVAETVHGLTQERLEAEGVSAIGPLLLFAGAVAMGREIVAHNLPFDMRVLTSELDHANLPPPPATGICTMAGARKAGAKGTLAKAHETLVGRPMDGAAHDAMGDAMACLEILRALRRKEAA